MKLSVDLRVLMFRKIRKELTLPIYFGERTFLKLYAVTAKHWSTLFETGSQFIFSNSFFPIWLLSLSPFVFPDMAPIF